MNVINRFFLGAVLLPMRLYTGMGINGPQLKAILTTKLLMDDRRPNSFHTTQRKKQEKPISLATVGTMIMTALLGLFLLVGFTVGKDYVTHLTVYFSIYIFLLTSTLISDFTSVLIDVRDNYIILPKPVNDRTVVVARLLHIGIHISKLVVPMTLPGLVYMAINTSIWGTISVAIIILLATVLTIFLVNALYIIILKVTTPAKFQTVISYFQIFFSIFIYASYQLVPRMINKAGIAGFDISANGWVWLAPSYWFAGAWQCIANGDLQLRWIVAAVISIFAPVLSLWVVVKYFAPSFTQKLSLIGGSGSETAPETENAKALKPAASTLNHVASIAQRVTLKGAERMSFLFCWKMTSRSKEFKMKVYPSFGYMLVYMVLLFYNSKTFSVDAFRTQNTQGKILLMSFVYFSSFMLVIAISQIMYSDKFKAAWIYFTTPITSPGHLISGAVKAAMLKFYVPIIALIAIPAVWLIGPKAIPNLVLGLFNQLLICAIIAYITVRYLPFSVQQSASSKSGGFIRGLFSLIIPAIVGFVHYMVYDFIWVIVLLAALSIIGTWLVLGSIKNITWKTVKSTYAD